MKTITIFFNDWWCSRVWGDLAHGLPALVVGGAVVVIVLMGVFADQQELVQAYETAGAEALNEEEHGTAELSFRKLSRLQPEEYRYPFAIALIAEREGNLDEARQRIAALAPLEQPKFAAAHLWMALDIARDSESLTPETARMWERHLKSAIVLQPTHLQAHTILGTYYLRQRRYDVAAPHLAAVVDRRPDLRLELAKVYRVVGDEEKARDQAREYSRLQAAIVEDDDGNKEARLRWVAAEVFLGRFREAVQILQEGQQRWPDDRFRLAMARVLAAWSDTVSDVQRYELLQQAMTLAPQDGAVLQKLLPLAGGNSPHRKEVRAQLEEMLAEGRASAMIHFTLGTIASEEGDMEKARVHLEQAVRQNEKVPAVLNNLAWVLAMSDPPQLERALELADSAARLQPGNAHILETRGEVYFQMEKWQEAIADLEQALPGLKGDELRKAIHRRLAVAYGKLGQEELAAVHREKAGGETE